MAAFRHNPRIIGFCVLLLSWGMATEPTSGQIFHRSRCEQSDCSPEEFRLAIERMTLTEGPLATDRDARDLGEIVRRIERELVRRPTAAELWLALSEAEYGMGDPLSAMTSATRALELGADSALALRARAAARMRVSGGEYDGAALYLEALAGMTNEARPRFLADVLPLLIGTELDWWRSADLERLRPWIREYWEHRAALAGVRVEDRIAEHMRRMSTASRLYAPTGTGSGAPGDADVLRSPALNILPFDDRGLVYVRRGPPQRELSVTDDVFSDLPTLTWIYGSVDGSADVFHFARSGTGGSGYRLVTPPACDPGYIGSYGSVVPVTPDWVMTDAGTSDGATTAGTTEEITRAVVTCFGGDRFTHSANRSMNRMALRREAMHALAVESPRAPFHRALPAYFEHYVFRGEGNTTEVVTPVAVPVGPDESQPVELLVTFAARDGGVVGRNASSSSARAAVRQSIVSEGEGWGVAYATTVVKPSGDAAFRVMVRDPSDPDRGGLWGGSIAIRGYDGLGLEMSDLVVSGSGPATWARGSTRLFLLPARSFSPGADAVIFYEVYGLDTGGSYSTEIVLTPRDEGLVERIWRALTGRSEVRIRFDSQVPESAGATVQVVRSLGLPEEEGGYTLTVRIRSAAGESSESMREVIISDDAVTASGGISPPVAPAVAEEGEQE